MSFFKIWVPAFPPMWARARWHQMNEWMKSRCFHYQGFIGNGRRSSGNERVLPLWLKNLLQHYIHISQPSAGDSWQVFTLLSKTEWFPFLSHNCIIVTFPCEEHKEALGATGAPSHSHSNTSSMALSRNKCIYWTRDVQSIKTGVQSASRLGFSILPFNVQNWNLIWVNAGLIIEHSVQQSLFP